MERITQWAFRNRAGVIVSVLIVLVMGIVSYFTLPKELLPQADQQMVMVTTLAQGIDASTMDDEVAGPIQRAVSSVQGKTEVDSTSGDGYSQVTIYFDSNTNMKDAKAAVSDALSTVQFPDGVAKPFITQLNTSEIPVADVGITFNHAITQTDVDTVKNQIIPRYQQIQGVSNAGVYGDNPTQVLLHVDKNKLAQYHLPLQTVMGVLQGQSLAVAVADATIDSHDAGIKVIGNVDSLDALKNLNVVPGLKLKDIATVSTSRGGQTLTHVNGHDAVLVFIQKTGNANAVSVAKDARSVSDQINQDFGPAIHAHVAFATADFVLDSVNSMMREVLTGALFATIVILLFLRNIRMTLVTVVSIPLSLGLTLFLLSETGVTLNILTLGAVAVAVGRLVDDSIVVIENTYRKSQLQGSSRETIVEAVKEVATAITSSTLTTVAVFLPIGLVSGSLQQLLLPFALTVVYSLLSSLVVALTVVPLLSARMLKNAKLREHRRPIRYIKTLTWMLNHKWVPLTVAVLIFIGTIGAYVTAPKGQMNSSDSTNVSVSLNYPSNTPFQQVTAGAVELEKFITQQPEPRDTLVTIGNTDTNAKYGGVQSPTLASFNVILKPGSNADTFIKHVSSLKSKFPTADLSASTLSGGFGGGSDINVDIMGSNPQDLLNTADKVVRAVKGIDGVVKVTTNQQDVKPTYEITVNPGVANAQDIAMQLRSVLNQVPIGTMKLNGKDTPVLVDRFINPSKSTDLNDIVIGTKTGAVPLSKLASIQRVDKPSTVYRKDGNEFVRVSIQPDPNKLSVVQQQVTLKTKDIKLPSGVTMGSNGAAAHMADDFSNLGKTMLVAIGVVYLIMVLTFKTLRAPLAILFTLPLAAVGAVLGIVVTRTTVDQSSLIGMLILIGIVVTNAIVLLDRVRHNEPHMTIRDAIVEAAATRVRPILMTAVATICAMLPLVIMHSAGASIVSKGLAVVVIAGLAVATLLTLVIVPVIYELLYFRKSKKQRLAQQVAQHTGHVSTLVHAQP